MSVITHKTRATDRELREASQFLSQERILAPSCSVCRLFIYAVHRRCGSCLITGESVYTPEASYVRGEYCPFPSVTGDETWRRVDRPVRLFTKRSEVTFHRDGIGNSVTVTTRRLKTLRIRGTRETHINSIKG